jgi:hypothetical protein
MPARLSTGRKIAWRLRGFAAILAASPACRSIPEGKVREMSQLEDAYRDLAEADGLAEVLDAGYGAFLAVLSVIQAHQDRHDDLFAAFVLAGGPASHGRFAIHAAPALSSAASARPIPDCGPRAVPSRDAADAIGRLGQLLVSKLTVAAAVAREPEDRRACTEAARHARALTSLFDGAPP